MRKYNIFMALFISLLLSACGNVKDTTGKTDSTTATFESVQQNQTESTRQEPLSQEISIQSPAVECETQESEHFYEEQEDHLITITQKGKLRQDMPEITFALSAFYDFQLESYALQTVDVYQDNTLLQTISIPELTLYGQTYISSSFQDTLGFELEDVNFDGYQDIRLFDTLNGNYRTEWVYLVWNPAEQQFQHDSRLNQISLASFDQEEQLIYGMERSGAACHYLSTYQYIDGEIVKIRYYEEEGRNLSDEQIKQYYDIASVKTSGVSFEAWYEHTMERNAASGELETVCEEYVFIPYDSDGKQIENEEEELHVDVSSALGAQIREAFPSYQK